MTFVNLATEGNAFFYFPDKVSINSKLRGSSSWDWGWKDLINIKCSVKGWKLVACLPAAHATVCLAMLEPWLLHIGLPSPGSSALRVSRSFKSLTTGGNHCWLYLHVTDLLIIWPSFAHHFVWSCSHQTLWQSQGTHAKPFRRGSSPNHELPINRAVVWLCHELTVTDIGDLRLVD